MKSNKLFSMILAASLAFSAFATIASADATVSMKGKYYLLSNTEKVSERTPGVETTVEKLTSAEDIAATEDSFGLMYDDYKDTTQYSIYKVTGKVTGIGNLYYGYDANGDFKNQKAKISFSTVQPDIYLGENKGKIVDIVDVDGFKDTLTSKPWNTGMTSADGKDYYAMYIKMESAEALPTSLGMVENPEMSFSFYVVTAADEEAFTLSYSTTRAFIMYSVTEPTKSLENQAVQVKLAPNSDSFTIGTATVENKWTFTKTAVTEKLKDNNKLWKLDVAKSGTPGDITSFGVTFTGKNGENPVSTTRSIKASTINAAVADWNTATSFYVGLNNKSGYTDIDATFSGNAVTGTTVEFK